MFTYIRCLRWPAIALGVISLFASQQKAMADMVPPGEKAGNVHIISNTSTYLKYSDLRSFQNAFQAIAKAGNVTIIAEGAPLYPVLSDDDFRKLESALPNTSLSISEIIRQVAGSFDYELVVLVSGVVIERL